MARLLGVDIGGTHTDLAFVDEASGRLEVAKVPTTTGDESDGLLNGIEALGIGCSDIDLLIHGTTVATNALIERKGATCGLIMTEGFRDTLELRRRDRPKTYGLTGEFRPLIPRRFRREVAERTTAEGTVLKPVNLKQVEKAARELRQAGAEVIIVSFLHSYANPANERAAGERLRKFWPNDYVVLGSDIFRAVREFERTSTAAISGYIQPVIGNYLSKLVSKLRARGYKRDLLIVQSNGGVMAAPLAVRLAANTILSGPAGGVTASAAIAADVGVKNVVSCDMGGTSFDVCVIRNGRPSMTQQKAIDFGLPLCLPMLDVDALAAGGGSLARLDAAGILAIGPESAGANPGPACYGRGGTIPTITDANVVVGILDPERAIGKGHGVSMDRDLARAAIERGVGQPLKLEVEAAAEAVLTVAGTTMAGHLRRRLIEKGLDPRSFSLLAFGGAGPLHANRILREVGLEQAIIPYHPGIASAMGCMLGQLRHDLVRTVNMRLSAFDSERLIGMFNEQAEEGRALLAAEGVPPERMLTQFGADMCYRGQTHVLSVRFQSKGPWTPEMLRNAFESTYQERYSQLLPGVDIIIVNARTEASSIDPRPSPSSMISLPGGGAPEPVQGKVFFGGAWRACAFHERMSLPAGATVEGPAVLNQMDSTTFVEPGYVATVHPTGNIIIKACA